MKIVVSYDKVAVCPTCKDGFPVDLTGIYQHCGRQLIVDTPKRCAPNTFIGVQTEAISYEVPAVCPLCKAQLPATSGQHQCGYCKSMVFVDAGK